MQLTPNVTSPTNTHPGVTSGMGGAPETGGFDFLGYLLGLQVTGQNEFQSQTPSQAMAGGKFPSEKPETDDALLALFNKRGKDSLGSLLAGIGAPQPGTLPTMANLSPSVNFTASSMMNPQKGSLQTVPSGSESVGSPQELLSLDQRAEFVLMGEPKADQVTSQLEVGEAFSGSGSRKDLLIQKYAVLANEAARTEEPIAELTPLAVPQAAAGVFGLKEKIEPQGKHAADAVSNLQKMTTAQNASGLSRGVQSEPLMESAVKLNASNGSVSEDPLERSEKRGGGDSKVSLSLLFDPTAVKNNSPGATGASKSSETNQTSAQRSVPELFNQVESMVHHGGGKMTVSLTPPHLGHVEIQVKTKGNQVEIEMTSQNAMAKSAIEGGLHSLRHSMESQDLFLSKMEVNVGHDVKSHLGNEAFSSSQEGSQQSMRHFQEGAEGGRSSQRFLETDNSRRGVSAVAASEAPSRVVTRSPGRVDLRI